MKELNMKSMHCTKAAHGKFSVIVECLLVKINTTKITKDGIGPPITRRESNCNSNELELN